MSTDQKFQRLAESVDGFVSVEELKTLRSTEWEHGTFKEFAHAIQQAASRRLHPMRGQVYPRSQWLKSENRNKLQLGVKIDGLRHIAERSGEYAGQRGPFWYDQEGNKHDVWLKEEHPAACVVEILRHDFEAPIRGIARWDDYAPYHYNKKQQEYELAYMWDNMGAHMISKCAEANGHRKAFQVGDLYIEEEMHIERTDEERGQREPADAHEESQRKADEVNQALGLGGDGAPDGGTGSTSNGESAPENGRTPGTEKGEDYQEKAREAAQERAEQNNAPDRTISTGDGSQLNLLFAKGVHGGPYTKKSLKKMIKREFGVESITDLLAKDFDRALEYAQDERMASNYIGDPDTKNMEFPDEEDEPESVTERVLQDYDVTDTERQNLRDMEEKVRGGLKQFDDLSNKNVSAAGFLQKVEGHTEIRREVVEETVREFGIEPIPQDFPHRARLIGHIIWTMQTVHENVRTGAIEEIDGIGESRREEIVQAMGRMDFEPLPDELAEAREQADEGWDDPDWDDEEETPF